MSQIVSEPQNSPRDRTGIRTAALVVAAGKGLRAGQPVPKQFARWRGKPVVRHSVEALAAAGCAPILVVIPDGAQAVAREALAGIAGVQFTTGGATRQESVRLGLEVLAGAEPDRVLIHDAARPLLPAEVIERLLIALDAYKGAIPVLPVADSLTHAAGDLMGAPARREDLRRVQTPQAFHFAEVLAAHRDWDGPTNAGDDAQVAQAWGMDVALVEGDETLHKLTYAADFGASKPLVRVGSGYDVHRLEEGEELWLCGVRIAHTHGLSGHSDADVAIHALVDAMLGAIGAGDIGQHFPPSDPQWKGAASDRFLAHAGKLVADEGYALANADVTIICEAPKIGPHREAMRERLADILGVDIAAISVKATTTEKLGFTGRREGIAAQAVVSLGLV
ncbi:bifunctional 2-C-methyl-D-erythritol 4-phosphate cytidylyltransferase/2-C-methyl-D-erythritol 2,4-cyclodiphosphate synthase [Novosphingobium resinovorum]|uniref:bifunctional 2-C-methyl-D-erythritol 4-phosphate cytidylyltransferase/2-C-methyl-D-erythritol 2,4-cyclodiphosphate synthase n=1 Tax=Sphingomonadaceae TaxID=41297 RepID=UPI00027C9B3F|nr:MULTISPECIES: bifunctional 2-C-methyl-D-erythritol 4-phosphate cytidylyltransferase/2-C-methyl-D-erythritol 2,4-cyclodiphosphate synthase [Sphingomonadaceae]EJU14112.1 bifunctional 2-C-methyl-D-erythritol 4-phosphate cytidylyltransferase/2-C-methyl-D-erythritol 2,4-cyclodiphosphate synthase protein [Sphingomonas sp. LH128]MBF7011439.1 bifunctional 2-C-methyl-D-erythritol 4-phosphate cytidylyltransferase/2-C-methyl-D-erythritol 2,4-cyclodiphosphate synthase [Novosphingobium sp. HR1a]WJM29417.1